MGRFNEFNFYAAKDNRTMQDDKKIIAGMRTEKKAFR
jgi:hypothetical protein